MFRHPVSHEGTQSFNGLGQNNTNSRQFDAKRMMKRQGAVDLLFIGLVTGMQEFGLHPMVSSGGNATVKNLFRLFKVCEDREGIHSADEFLSHMA